MMNKAKEKLILASLMPIVVLLAGCMHLHPASIDSLNVEGIELAYEVDMSSTEDIDEPVEIAVPDELLNEISLQGLYFLMIQTHLV